MKISFIIDKLYHQNKIFDENDHAINRDDCQRSFIELRRKLAEHNIFLDTADINPINKSDLAIFLNVPDPDNEYFKEALLLGKPCYVIINELEMIHPQNANLQAHKYFKKVFTYQQDLVDEKTSFKLNYAFNFKQKLVKFHPVPFEKKKFCTLIAGYKKLNHPLELYSERIKTIRWFENNHSSDFDLYGHGWNNYGFLRSLITRKFPSYRGTILEKQAVLSQYKFNICYENAKDVPGWITEKIFDSFFAGTIPVYWGWSGVSNYIPENCFIKRNDFKNNSEMYQYLACITEKEYNLYIENISAFLKIIEGDSDFEFGIPYFVKTIEKEILNDFNFIDE